MAKSTSTTDTDAKRRDATLGMWIAIGVGIGTAFGVIFDQIALGISLGAGLGIVIGAVLTSRGKGRRADRQDPEA